MMQEYQGTKEKWNVFVAANAEDGGVLQSWEWGELEKKEGYNFWRLAWEENGELAACCLLVEWKLPFGLTYLYANRGPVLKFPISNFQFPKIISDLEKFAREQGAIFLRIEPPYSKNLQLTTYNLQAVHPVQPHQTLRINLTQSEDELLKAMHQKTRYNIGLAEKRGVRVEGKNDIDAFFKLLETTTARDGFHMHPRVHYETILTTLDAKLFFATHNGQPLATALVAFFGSTAYYLHGASANEHRDVMAPYALHWEIMREAKRRGCTAYDLWGVDEKRWPGVTRFKQGFAPTTPFTTYTGTYDLPLRKIPYALYRVKKLL